MNRLSQNLKKILTGKVLILGVGNTMRGDDGTGPALIERISGRVSAVCFDAGMTPENFLEKVVHEKPAVVLIVDAADFGGKPGEARVFGQAEVGGGGLSTHALSLQMTCDYLKARSPVHVFLLAVQPESTTLGEGMSRIVSDSIDELAAELTELLRKEKC